MLSGSVRRDGWMERNVERYNIFSGWRHFETSSLLLLSVIFLSAVMIFSFSARLNYDTYFSVNWSTGIVLPDDCDLHETLSLFVCLFVSIALYEYTLQPDNSR